MRDFVIVAWAMVRHCVLCSDGSGVGKVELFDQRSLLPG